MIASSRCDSRPRVLRLSWRHWENNRTQVPSSPQFSWLIAYGRSLLKGQPGRRVRFLHPYHRAADRKPAAPKPGRLSILADSFLRKPHGYPADTCIANVALTLVGLGLVEDEGMFGGLRCRLPRGLDGMAANCRFPTHRLQLLKTAL